MKFILVLILLGSVAHADRLETCETLADQLNSDSSTDIQYDQYQDLHCDDLLLPQE